MSEPENDSSEQTPVDSEPDRIDEFAACLAILSNEGGAQLFGYSLIPSKGENGLFEVHAGEDLVDVVDATMFQSARQLIGYLEELPATAETDQLFEQEK